MRRLKSFIFVITISFFTVFFLASCDFFFSAQEGTPSGGSSHSGGGKTYHFWLKSSAFDNGSSFPKNFDQNKSFPLEWNNTPRGTNYYAISIYDTSDNNAHLFFLYNIPFDIFSIKEGLIDNPTSTPSNVNIGKETARIVYFSPITVRSRHYVITLFALDKKADVNALDNVNTTVPAELEKAFEKDNVKVIATTSLNIN